MRIGIPKEVKNHEYRVGSTPLLVRSLVEANHLVVVQKDAGRAIGFPDSAFDRAGARVVSSLEEVYEAEMIIKVKEPQPVEYPLLKRGQILFCFLHLAPDFEQAAALLEKEVVGIAFETVVDRQGRLPLLMPMSEVAGRIALQVGVNALHIIHGGRGVLIGGVPGVETGRVVIVGGGIVGTQAAEMAIGLKADVTILDHHVPRLRELDVLFGGRVKTLYSSSTTLEEAVIGADLVIGAVLIPGKTAPKLISEKMVCSMKEGAVIVDVAIDQGGCVETSRPTTHASPTFISKGVVHYCVTNIPGACARTATMALTNSIFPYALQIANHGYKKALLGDPHLLSGLNVAFGKVTNQHVAADLGYDYHPPEHVLKSL